MESGACEFTLNGTVVSETHSCAQTTLLDFIRARRLTGAKEGCAEGECGACAVLLLRNTPTGTAYTSVNSCLIPLPAMAGQEVFTVEGLADSKELAAAQQAMAAAGGSQCGYCTPGFVVSMFAEHYRREERPPDPHSLGGNLCRCTGYRPIRDALLSLGDPPAGAHRERLDRPAPELRPYSYVSDSGRFTRPEDLSQCLELIGKDPAARPASGQRGKSRRVARIFARAGGC